MNQHEWGGFSCWTFCGVAACIIGAVISGIALAMMGPSYASTDTLLSAIAGFWGFGVLLSLFGVLFGLCRMGDPEYGTAAKRGLWLNAVAFLMLLLPACIITSQLNARYRQGTTFYKVTP